jgi:glutamate-1-semialdehyde 2,1-aminomutase
MLARGIYMHPWHNMFLCAAMTEADIDATLAAADAAFAAVAARRATLGPHPILVMLAAAQAEHS